MAARPIWKGHLSFGLVMMPVTLYSAEEPQNEIKLTMLDERDHARIRYQRINEVTGKEVPWKSIVKGHEVGKGQYVILTEQDFKKAAPREAKTVEITDFVAREEIEPKYFERPYVLEPGEGGAKVYALLRESLAKTGRVGIAHVVIHTREYLAAVYPEDGVLILKKLRFADEVRDVKDLGLRDPKAAAGAKAAPAELDMAKKLVESMTSEWKPEKYHDHYREALKKWIEQRAAAAVKGLPPPEAEEEAEEVGGPYNIMEMLRKSVDGQKKGGAKRGGSHAHSRRKAG